MSAKEFKDWEVQVLKKVASERVASQKELKGQYADKEVRKDPPKWSGDSFVGRKWSECPPDYLDRLAGFFEWRANKDKELPEAEQRKSAKGKPYWQYDLADARLMRGWAIKNATDGPRQVEEALPPPAPEPPPLEDDEIPF